MEKRMQFVDVCALEDLLPGSGLAVRIGGKDVALFDVHGTVHALENSCVHAGASLADDGRVLVGTGTPA